MANFFDTNINAIQTEYALVQRGLKINTAFLRSIGIYPVAYPYPLYNESLYILEPSGEPHPKADDPQNYVQDFAVTDLPLAVAQTNMKAQVTARRWQAETGGITLPDGTHLLTTREDQAVITGAVTRVMLKPDTTIDFKTASGAWVSVDAARMIALGLAVSEHVEHCFSRERALHEAIDKAESVDDLKALNIESGWPETAENEPSPVVQSETPVVPATLKKAGKRA